jgi:hypothetical protein
MRFLDLLRSRAKDELDAGVDEVRDRQVRLTVVGDEIQAEMLTQRLEAAGIGSAYRPLGGNASAYTGPVAPGGFAQEIIVWESSLDAARALLKQFGA